MSMISAQIDELNKSADEWNSSNMFELARMCREAADIIWELRDDLQRANDAVRDAEHDESLAWDRVSKAEAEADKLRELVHRLISHVEHPPCEGCMAEMNCDGEHVTQCDEWLFMVADARKLGVEVPSDD